jgi:hypothetical protein
MQQWLQLQPKYDGPASISGGTQAMGTLVAYPAQTTAAKLW